MIEIGVDNGIRLSSQLRTVEIATNFAALVVTLAGPDGNALLSGKYYATGGVVRIVDLRQIVEDTLRTLALPLAKFTLNAYVEKADIPPSDDDQDTVGEGLDYNRTATMAVLYCDREMATADPAELLRTNFLTTAIARRIAPGDAVGLSLYAQQGERLTLMAHADYLTADGSRRQRSLMLSDTTAPMATTATYTIDTAHIAQLVAQQEGQSVELLALTATCGDRSISLFLTPGHTSATLFSFRNCFNVEDSLRLPGITKARSTADRSLATIAGTSLLYDQSTLTEYELQSAALDPTECEQFRQLCFSHAAAIGGKQILITDFTCEISDTDEKPNTVKLTYRHSLDRTNLCPPTTPGIFTQQYNSAYQ